MSEDIKIESENGAKVKVSELLNGSRESPIGRPMSYETLTPFLDSYNDPAKILVIHQSETTGEVTKVKFLDRQDVIDKYGADYEKGVGELYMRLFGRKMPSKEMDGVEMRTNDVDMMATKIKDLWRRSGRR